MLIHELLGNDPDMVPVADPIIVLDRKSAVCMSKNSKDTNNTRHIARKVHLARNGENVKCTRLTGVKEVFSGQKL